MFVPQPFPYQGSKRKLARQIVSCFPPGAAALLEPFAGSAAVSLASASLGRATRFVLNDLNQPLIRLWDRILAAPDDIAADYLALWERQTGREREFYDEVRREFNATGRADLFLYLLARCVKASVRYNSSGEFNQSPDNRRRGMNPATMRVQLRGAAQLLAGRTELSCMDYREVLDRATPADIVYMDPPYQGVSGDRDSRYVSGVDVTEFAQALDGLNRRRVPFVVSYDGRTGDKQYGTRLPDDLGLLYVELDAGPSTQATLLGGRARTYEGLYLSAAVARKVDGLGRVKKRSAGAQLVLFGE